MQTHRAIVMAAALVLAGAGLATAQNRTNSPGAESPTGSMNRDSTTGTTTTNPAGGAVKNAPGAESTTGNANSASFGADMVGKTVYNRNGEAIGQVKAAEQGRLIVSVGSYLGMGSRDVSLTRAHINQSGTAADQQRLVTTLTKDEIKALPEVSAANRSGSTPRDPAGSTTGGSGKTR